MITATFIFNLIVFFVISGFILDRILSWLNSRNWKDKVPAEMENVYDQEKYRKAKLYDRAHTNFSLWSSIYGLSLILCMLFFNGFAMLDEWVRVWIDHTYYTPLIFFGLLMLASDLLNMPFSVYSTFVIEAKYGFNKTGPLLFVVDKIKSWLLGALIGAPILAFLVWVYETFGSSFWIGAWIVMSGLAIFISMFYTSLIVPIFNKLKPLEDGELKSAIQVYCREVGFNLSNLSVIDGSKRSTKSNAYFSGLGPRKQIVLFDTLIENQEVEEIVAVLAHEIGHYKLKHTRISLLLSIIQTGIMLFLLSLVLDNTKLGLALGTENMSFHIGLIAFALLYTPVSTITGIFMNMLSRKNEYEADSFATRTFNGLHMINALKKLSVDNLSNLNPHPAYVFVHFSHPPILDRISAIKREAAIKNSVQESLN